MYSVKLPKFEGPLNLLLELIEEKKLDINEVSISKVADDFLEYVRGAENIPLENLAEFVGVASKIILIKSRSILPTLEITAEEEKEIKDLEEQLRIYKRFKEGAAGLGKLFEKRGTMRAREYLATAADVFAPPRDVNPYDLKKHYLKIIEQIVLPEKIPEESVREIITLEQKIEELRESLQERIEMSFAHVKSSAKNKVDVIVSFLAMLEMVKQRIISAEQKELFSDILMKKMELQKNGTE